MSWIDDAMRALGRRDASALDAALLRGGIRLESIPAADVDRVVRMASAGDLEPDEAVGVILRLGMDGRHG